MSSHLREDYETLVLAGVKRVADGSGKSLLVQAHQQALDRLIACGLAAREGDAFVLRQSRDATTTLDEPTRQLLDTLHTLWMRLDDHTTSEDEILYGELGYWQHWANVLHDGTDRTVQPLRMDIMIPARPALLSRHWAQELDPDIVEHVFSHGLVNIRLLVPPAAHGAAVQTMIESALRLGVQVRVFPSNLEFSVFDGQVAVVHDESHHDNSERYRLTRRVAVVEPLAALFELRWATAIPWEGFVRGTGGVLHLLAQGWTDARIAEALGTSTRTVSRRIAEMMQAAGVESRFELGMKYALQELGSQGANG